MKKRNEVTDLDGFPHEIAGGNEQAAHVTGKDVEWKEGAESDAGSDAEQGDGIETAIEAGDAAGSAVVAPEVDAENGSESDAESGGAMGGANGTMELNEREKEANVGDNLRRVFTRRGREVRPPKRFDL